jgi:hypothetical protein
VYRDQQVLTEEEILQRRKAKVVKLLQLYKLQYYRLQVQHVRERVVIVIVLSVWVREGRTTCESNWSASVFLQDNLQSSFELYNKKVALEREKQGRTGEGKKYHSKGTGDKRTKPKKDQEQVGASP